jgi:hypothetical protein
LLAAASAHTVYISRDQGKSWRAVEPASEVEVTGAAMQGDALYLITRYHGVLAQDSDTLTAAALR